MVLARVVSEHRIAAIKPASVDLFEVLARKLLLFSLIFDEPVVG